MKFACYKFGYCDIHAVRTVKHFIFAASKFGDFIRRTY